MCGESPCSGMADPALAPVTSATVPVSGDVMSVSGVHRPEEERSGVVVGEGGRQLAVGVGLGE